MKRGGRPLKGIPGDGGITEKFENRPLRADQLPGTAKLEQYRLRDWVCDASRKNCEATLPANLQVPLIPPRRDFVWNATR